MSRRQLSDEERALWGGFAHSITPLRRSRKSAKPPGPPPATPLKAAEIAPMPATPAPSQRHDTAPSAKSPPLATLGRRVKQRIARGRDAIDARLDLHGLTQTEAHAVLLEFLHRARDDGARTVLVVTGKGAAHDAESGRGVLRRQVPMWFVLPEFRRLIVGFDVAHDSHGGYGALYVRLRRGKQASR